jgi:hypothetical protein
LQRQQTSDDEDDLISCHCLYTTKQFYGFGKAIPSLAIANTFQIRTFLDKVLS